MQWCIAFCLYQMFFYLPQPKTFIKFFYSLQYFKKAIFISYISPHMIPQVTSLISIWIIEKLELETAVLHIFGRPKAFPNVDNGSTHLFFIAFSADFTLIKALVFLRKSRNLFQNSLFVFTFLWRIGGFLVIFTLNFYYYSLCHDYKLMLYLASASIVRYFSWVKYCFICKRNAKILAKAA